jgi:bifunctional non-homologous end joining protein LigD
MPTLTEPKLENTTLYYRAGSSDKVYQCQIEPAGERFVVTFAYGRRGSTLNTGTKTNVPVDYDNARRLFHQLVKEKQAKGYTPGLDVTPYQQPATEDRFTGILPQLLNPIDEVEVKRLLHDDDYCAQEKFDGRHLLVRKQAGDLHGINKKGLLTGLPLTVANDLKQLPGNFMPDGEGVGDVYHAFDLLVLNGEDLRLQPYHRRLTALMHLLAGAQHRFVRYTETAFTTRQKRALWDRLRIENREGIVFKRLDAPYTPGRPNSGGPQLKHKFHATVSCVVAKINAQRSVEVRLLGEDGWLPCGNVTIPPNHKIPDVCQVVEVRYLYAYRASHALYQPVYLGPRTDVAPEECRLTQLKYKSEDELSPAGDS